PTTRPPLRATRFPYTTLFRSVGWLEELPKQVTNLSWDNAAIVSIATMADLKAEETNLIELELNGRKVTVPVLMAPGHPDGVITLDRKSTRLNSSHSQISYAVF